MDGWMDGRTDGWTDGRTDGWTENLPILQDFVPYWGRCPKSMAYPRTSDTLFSTYGSRSVRHNLLSAEFRCGSIGENLAKRFGITIYRGRYSIQKEFTIEGVSASNKIMSKSQEPGLYIHLQSGDKLRSKPHLSTTK